MSEGAGGRGDETEAGRCGARRYTTSTHEFNFKHRNTHTTTVQLDHLTIVFFSMGYWKD